MKVNINRRRNNPANVPFEVKEYRIPVPVFEEHWYENPITGKKLNSSFRVDFKIADAFGPEAIIDTYKRAKSEWHFSVEYMAELVLSLYWAITTNIKCASLYYDLWQDCHTFCCNHFKDEQLTEYLNIINEN